MVHLASIQDRPEEVGVLGDREPDGRPWGDWDGGACGGVSLRGGREAW